MRAIFNFSKWLCISYLRSYRTEIWKLSIIPQNILFWPIWTHNWICLVKQLLLLKRELKVPEGPSIPPQDLKSRVRSPLTSIIIWYILHMINSLCTIFSIKYILYIKHSLYYIFCIYYTLFCILNFTLCCNLHCTL